MPQRNSSRRTATRLVLFTAAGWALWALGRTSAEADAAAETRSPDPWRLDVELDEVTAKPKPNRPGWNRRRLATSLTFATLFFAGAAFSAGAGDTLVEAVEDDEPAAAETTTETTAEEPAPEAAPPIAEAPADEPAAETSPADATEPADGEAAPSEPAPPAPSEDDSGEASPTPAPAEEQPAKQGGAPAANPAPAPEPGPGPAEGTSAASKSAGNGAPAAAGEADHDHGAAALEDEGGFPTIWLYRALPDPTPPARRLTREFATSLRRAAGDAGVDWALVLGVLRADGHRGRHPASGLELRRLANRLAALGAADDAWRAVFAYRERTAFADRSVALARYNRAVGLRSLVRGLAAAKEKLERRVLRDRRLDIYPGGSADVETGKVDVRVLSLLLYLAESHGQVTVSSLFSGHRYYSRPGVVSRHVHGLAVDIAALEGRSILGNQEPGGLTERAVRNILLLPVEVQPQQVISLLGLGGPSFPLADHGDHIHVGY
jgi:outer membrane biosynthesis protein TonB